MSFYLPSFTDKAYTVERGNFDDEETIEWVYENVTLNEDIEVIVEEVICDSCDCGEVEETIVLKKDTHLKTLVISVVSRLIPDQKQVETRSYMYGILDRSHDDYGCLLHFTKNLPKI